MSVGPARGVVLKSRGVTFETPMHVEEGRRGNKRNEDDWSYRYSRSPGLEMKGIGLAKRNVESGSPAVSIDADADADADARRIQFQQAACTNERIVYLNFSDNPCKEAMRGAPMAEQPCLIPRLCRHFGPDAVVAMRCRCAQ